MSTKVTVIRGQGGTRKSLGEREVPRGLVRGAKFELKEYRGVTLTVNTVINGEVLAYATPEDYDDKLVDDDQAAA